jgi:4-amino-4-deoxy-L-arabinose transferase-like glycosyltransferase
MIQEITKPDNPLGSASAAIARRPEGKPRWEAWIPYALALIFFLFALRGVGQTDVIDTDAARHAMNGAFLYDLVRTGHWAHPVAYAKAYYAQYPALSMPYHPPLFPAVEAIFFAIFGVNLLTARLLVALCVGLSTVLLYRLVNMTLGGPLLAGCVTIASFSLWTVQLVGRDVMLEFPAMVFTLAALYCLRDMGSSFPMRRAIWFALFASAAVWTKQHAVFLGAVPFLDVIATRRWRRLLEAPLWVGSILFCCAVLGLIALSRMFHGTGVNQMSTSTSDVYWILTRTLPAYFRWIVHGLRGVGGVFALCAIAVYALVARRRDIAKPNVTLYMAWIVALCGLLVDLGPVSPRYLFFVFPAFLAVGYAWLFHGCRLLWGTNTANIAALAFTAAWVVTGLAAPKDFLRGPGAAAAAVVAGTPTRVLYVGPADGNFTFAVRAIDPNLKVTVIPAGKVREKIFEDTSIEKFCAHYGIEWVVFENIPGRQYWSSLYPRLQSSGKLVRTVPLESSRERWQTGAIEIYRFPLPPHPTGGVLELPVPNLGGSIPVTL